MSPHSDAQTEEQVQILIGFCRTARHPVHIGSYFCRTQNAEQVRRTLDKLHPMTPVPNGGMPYQTKEKGLTKVSV
jgi:hypothetical protein